MPKPPAFFVPVPSAGFDTRPPSPIGTLARTLKRLVGSIFSTSLGPWARGEHRPGMPAVFSTHHDNLFEVRTFERVRLLLLLRTTRRFPGPAARSIVFVTIALPK